MSIKLHMPAMAVCTQAQYNADHMHLPCHDGEVQRYIQAALSVMVRMMKLEAVSTA